ncbi:TipC family immunity protein [Streptococcus gallolyticus]|uniref:TipC family immunity protein n=2 Tax=Streptococcus gallolyticus TaxID=315405 RepID=UPI0022833664|nr:TipC family immunity protein [Streptococcus gallolyticus]
MRIKKMKKLKKWLIFFMSLVLLCLSYFSVRHYIIHNIFDEIYYNQKYSLGTPTLETIEGVSNPTSGEPIVDELQQKEYDEEHLPDSVTSLGYTFNYAKKRFSFEIRYDIGNDSPQTLNISYQYDVSKRQLSRKLWIFNGATHDNNKEYVQTFLEEYGSSIDECITFGDNVVKNVLLKDWCSVYNSRYSPDDWGDVTVKSRWED